MKTFIHWIVLFCLFAFIVLGQSFIASAHANGSDDGNDNVIVPDNRPIDGEERQAGSDQDVPLIDFDLRQGVQDRLRADGSDFLGDRVDPHMGALSFEHTDVSLPGNSDLIVAITRRRSMGEHFSLYNGITDFRDWELLTPRIRVKVTNSTGWKPQRCSTSYNDTLQGGSVGLPNGPLYTYNRFDYTNGILLEVPGRSDEQIYQNVTGPQWPTIASHITQNNWYFTCGSANDGGEGFVGHAPNGDTYRFDKVVKRKTKSLFFNRMVSVGRDNMMLMASEVTDVHGNWVRYTYNSSGQLTRILANDGREITLSHSNGRIQSVSANGRTWNYNYGPMVFHHHNVSTPTTLGESLKGVTLPDGLSWTFDLDNMHAEPIPGMICNGPTRQVSVTHPNGVTGTFSFKEQGHRQTLLAYYFVPRCEESEPTNWRRVAATFTEMMSVESKVLNLPTGETLTWNYDYENDLTTASGSNPPVSENTNWTRIDAPDGSQKRYYHFFGRENFTGKLDRLEIRKKLTNALLQTTQYAYVKEPVQAEAGLANVPESTHQTYIRTTSVEISRDNDIFTTEYDYNDVPTSPNYSFGYPTQTKVFSSVFGSTTPRISNTTYSHNTSQWVLGLPTQTTLNGTPTATYAYDSLGRKISETRFGHNFATYSYHTAAGYKGALHWMENGNGERTTALNWKRGTPQQITRADNTNVYQTVDNNGWLTSSTDALNRVDTFQHDSMGRLIKIDPHGSWDDTNISYNFSGGGAVQTITKGQSQSTITYDGLLRQTLSRTQDLSSSWNANVRTTYDGLGRVTFQSQPSTSSIEAKGVNTSYDALGRVLTVAETVAPFATTTHSYHSGHRHRVTDASGAWKDYYAYGYRGPGGQDFRLIDGNGLRSTQINQNQFGNITSTVQSGTLGGVSVSGTQYYYYDSRQRMCRYRGQEGGDTLYAYDDAGQMISYAKGISAGTTCATPSGISKVSQTYDPMGRPLVTDFTDNATPDITRTYDANGNLKSNFRGSGGTAINWTYTYNDADLLTAEALSVDGQAYNLGYTYNNSGHMTRRTHPNGFYVDFAPDGLGRATKASYGATQYASSASYHPNEALSAFTYGNGYSFNQALNTRQLVASLKSSRAGTKALDLNYSYDARGKITNVIDNAVSGQNKSYGYDALGQMTSATGPWGSMNVTYDSLGNIRARNIGSRYINMYYDGNNRLSSYTDTGGVDKTLTYDSRGNVIAMTENQNCVQNSYLNFQKTSQSTNWNHYPQVDVCQNKVTSLFSTSYNTNLSPAGDNFNFPSFSAGQNYTVSRSTHIIPSGSNVTVYLKGSLAAGNILSMEHRIRRANGTYSPWVFHGSLNFGTAPAPNPANNLTLTYDYSDQPVSVSDKANGSYRYDGNLKRVKSTVNGQTIYNVYNLAGQLIQIYQTHTGKRTDYVTLGGRTVARVVNKTAPTYVHGDHLGSPVTRSQVGGGLVVPREVYTPFGVTLNNAADLNDQAGFTGHIKDSATDLNYMQARYYDPIIGRFLSIDPVGFLDTGEPSYFNTYRYCSNDPVNCFDPTGMSDKDRNLLQKVGDAIMSIAPGGYDPSQSTGTKMQFSTDATGVMSLNEVPSTTMSEGTTQAIGQVGTALAASAGTLVPGANTSQAPAATRSATATTSKPVITQPYARPSNATTPAQRAAVQGKPCTDCGATTATQRANHTPALVQEYYSTGTINTTRMRSTSAVSPHCPTCSNAEGGRMSAFSKAMKKEHGFD